MKFALAGNPNCGKTTLFNALTGASAHVGNWPGVTVNKLEGIYKKLEEKIEIVDLPGIYSLSPYTPEEIVTRNFLIEETPDLVINIVDATNLERNLYLTTQLMEIDVPMILAINMMDIIQKNGTKINIKELEKRIGLKIVEISALRNDGLHELMIEAYKIAKNKSQRKASSILFSTSLQPVLQSIFDVFSSTKSSNQMFHAIKLMENDEIEKASHPKEYGMVKKILDIIPNDEFEGDYSAMIADQRYQFIGKCCKEVVCGKNKPEKSLTDRLDHILTHRFLGIPIFLGIMFLVFHLTFSENLFFIGNFISEGSFSIPIIGTDTIHSPGVMLAQIVELFTGVVSNGLTSLFASSPSWIHSLVVEALWGGLSAVLSFIPQIMCLFFFLSILEDSGYMARVAFIMDRAFRKIGLSGKAFMPLLMCFGCAVPGIMATRTLENEKERRLTIMLTPFFSCGAKLPIWGVFAAILFAGQYGDILVFSMYLLGIIVSIISAYCIKKLFLKGEVAPFIMELPSYHLPRVQNISALLWEKLKHYLVRAATIIAGAIIVIWFLTNFSFQLQMVENISDSILSIIARSITWIFVPLGFGMGEHGWMFVVAAFTGLIAKEMVPATLGSFAGMGEDEVLGGSSNELLGSSLAVLIGSISIPAALAFMAFNLLSVPCMAAVSAAKAELNSSKKLWITIGFWIGTAYVVSLLVYWIGTIWWIGLLLLAVLVLLFLFLLLKNRGAKNATH